MITCVCVPEQVGGYPQQDGAAATARNKESAAQDFQFDDAWPSPLSG